MALQFSGRSENGLIKMERKVLTVIRWILIAALLALVLLPEYWIFLSSITPESKILTSPIHYLPQEPTLENYNILLSIIDLKTHGSNTMIIIFFSMLLNLTISIPASYAFARLPFKGSGLIFAFIFGSTMLPASCTIIPMFELFRSLKLIGTFHGLIILYASSFIPFTTLTFMTFYSGIPKSIEEAAEIDGAGIFRKMITIIIPLLRPAIATLCIITFVNGMNEFMAPLIFGGKIKTLSLGITQIPRPTIYSEPWNLISSYAAIILTPVIIFVLIFEKNIMDGLISGGIKE